MADVRDAAAVRQALRRGGRGRATRRRWSGSASTSTTCPTTPACNDLGPRCCWPRWPGRASAGWCWPRSMVVYGEGAYDCAEHGRVRPARRGPAADLTRAGSSRAARAAASRCAPRLVERGRPAGPAQRLRRRPSSPRSTWPPAGPGRPTGRRWRCAITTCTGPGCRGTRRTPGWRRSSGPPGDRRARRGSSRTARQRRDFVHVRDVAPGQPAAIDATGAPGSARPGGWPGPARTTWPAATRAPWARWRQRWPASSAAARRRVVTGEYRLGDVRHIMASPAAAEQDLGFRAQVPFARGVSEFARAELRASARVPATLG